MVRDRNLSFGKQDIGFLSMEHQDHDRKYDVQVGERVEAGGQSGQDENCPLGPKVRCGIGRSGRLLSPVAQRP